MVFGQGICALVDGGEDTSGLDDVLSTDASPVDVGRVLLLEDGDGLALDPELAVLGLDGALVAAMYGVVLEHVDHVLKVDEGTANDVIDTRSGGCKYARKHLLVYGYDVDVSVEESITEDDTADTTCPFPSACAVW